MPRREAAGASARAGVPSGYRPITALSGGSIPGRLPNSDPTWVLPPEGRRLRLYGWREGIARSLLGNAARHIIQAVGGPECLCRIAQNCGNRFIHLFTDQFLRGYA